MRPEKTTRPTKQRRVKPQAPAGVKGPILPEMNLPKPFLALLAAWLFVMFPAKGLAQAFDPFLAARLQQQLDSLRSAYTVRGISVGVLLPAQGLWQGVSGFSHMGVPIGPDMGFGIASNTKLFTAAALLKIASAGVVGIDDRLSRWLPPIPNVDSSITLRQLLNHRSGIADINRYPGYRDSILANPNRIFSPEELLPWIGAPGFSPGSAFEYSNTNYLLAGMIFERATGLHISRYIRDSLLTPFGLHNTFYDVQEAPRGVLAQPWQNGMNIQGLPRFSLNSAAGAAGAMYSNSEEMALWYAALFQGLVLDTAAFALMTSPSSPSGYGMGITRQKIGECTVWGHGGDIIGYRSRMMYDSATQAVLCVLINANPAPVNEIAAVLLKTLTRSISTQSGANQAPEAPMLYPNPARGSHARIVLPASEFRSAALYDASGRLLRRITTTDISLQGLPPGFYLLRIQSRQGHFSRSLIRL